MALHRDQLVATMAVTKALRQDKHKLALLVDPGHAGQIESSLISNALRMLSDAPPRPVTIMVDPEQQATVQSIRDYSFKEQRTLLTMRKDFE